MDRGGIEPKDCTLVVKWPVSVICRREVKEVDAAWLAALHGGEGYWRYRNSKSHLSGCAKIYRYWRLVLDLEMAEEGWIKQAATLMEISYRLNRRNECYETTVEGYRAFEIVKAIQPYLFGLKAVAAAIIMSTGPTLPISAPRPELPSLKGKNKMDRGGIEPPTFRVQGGRSYR